MGTGGPFPGGKARPGRDADHSPPSSAEVVNEWELYLLSPQSPPWHAEGLLYFTFFYMAFCKSNGTEITGLCTVCDKHASLNPEPSEQKELWDKAASAYYI
jgi:hypothetical protein